MQRLTYLHIVLFNKLMFQYFCVDILSYVRLEAVFHRFLLKSIDLMVELIIGFDFVSNFFATF